MYISNLRLLLGRLEVFQKLVVSGGGGWWWWVMVGEWWWWVMVGDGGWFGKSFSCQTQLRLCYVKLSCGLVLGLTKNI